MEVVEKLEAGHTKLVAAGGKQVVVGVEDFASTWQELVEAAQTKKIVMDQGNS